jgi:hypothetical protein
MIWVCQIMDKAPVPGAGSCWARQTITPGDEHRPVDVRVKAEGMSWPMY